jgi:hypothetical protein
MRAAKASKETVASVTLDRVIPSAIESALITPDDREWSTGRCSARTSVIFGENEYAAARVESEGVPGGVIGWSETCIEFVSSKATAISMPHPRDRSFHTHECLVARALSATTVVHISTMAGDSSGNQTTRRG